jgi:FkbM family methyltransferase
MNDIIAALDIEVAEDAQRVMAKLNAAGSSRRGLFIDCGSKLGLGFDRFARHYPLQRFDYILVEPDPDCLPELQAQAARRKADTGARVEILEEAAGTQVGVVRFFGRGRAPQSPGDPLQQDPSSACCLADEGRALVVPAFSLSALIRERVADYPVVVLRLDIAGSEYEVLPQLIAERTHKLLDSAYIEFHSQYMAEPEASHYRQLEVAIRARLAADGLPYRVWF